MKIKLLSLLLIPVGFLSSCIHRPDTVFYSNWRPREVAAIPLNGGETRRISGIYTKGLVFNQKQKELLVGYYAVNRLNLDGSFGDTVLRTGQIKDIALDPGRGFVYWSQYGKRGTPNRIERCRLDGTGHEVVVSATVIGRIDVDPPRRKLYWAQGNSKAGDVRGIFRSNLDGSNPERIGNNFSSRVIAVDSRNRRLFWIDLVNRKNTLVMANLDGTNRKSLVNDLAYFVEDLAVDQARRKVYWAERRSGTVDKRARIRRCDYNGENVETVHESDSTYETFMSIELGRLGCTGIGAPVRSK